MNTKKPLAVLLCAALALTLAACGAKTDPEPQPTATPEVTATPEPTATPEEAMAEETNADVVTPVSKSVDLSNAIVHDGSEFGSTTDVYEVDGKYYLEDGHELKYDTKYNEWQVDLTEEFAGKKFDMTGEEMAEANKKAEEDTQKVVDAFESGEYDDILDKYPGL